jgi:large subunit ribosomal protein L22
MKLRALSKDVGISPLKVGMVNDVVRGKKALEALTILRFMPTPAAKAVAKTLKSAVANAENNFQMVPAELKIVTILAEKGHVAKRFRPQARGRVAPLLRRSCHIQVVVAGEEA